MFHYLLIGGPADGGYTHLPHGHIHVNVLTECGPRWYVRTEDEPVVCNCCGGCVLRMRIATREEAEQLDERVKEAKRG